MTALAAKHRDASEYIDVPVAAVARDGAVAGPAQANRGRRHLAALGGTISLGLAALFLWCPVHRFPQAQPCHGARWYIPYAARTPTTSGRKVNLHAHARAW